MIAADQQRRMIPRSLAMIFTEVTNAGLASMVTDPGLSAETRAAARWELDYRDAFYVLVDFDPQGNIRQVILENDRDAAREMELRDQEAADMHRQAIAARSRLAQIAIEALRASCLPPPVLSESVNP